MKVIGIQTETSEEANTVESTAFALRYLGDLGHDVHELSLEDPLESADVIVMSVPYVGDMVGAKVDDIINVGTPKKDVIWLLLLIEDDVMNKGTVTIKEFQAQLEKSGIVHTERFTDMTSEKNIPLQTRDMMLIMGACDTIHKQSK